MSGVPPYGKEMIVRIIEGSGETDFEKASCTQREHSQKFERRREHGQVIDLHQFFGLRPRKDLLNW